MNGTMKRTNYETYFKNYEAPKAYEIYEEKEADALIAENCNASGFSLAAVAGSILMCIGFVIYALLTM